MKNLLIYINPRKDFDDEGDEGKIAVKIQIDNCLDLGWKREDILLVTNFPYEYSGVKSLEISEDGYCSFYPQGSKSWVMPEIFEKGFIEKGEIYWLHDFDCYQNEVITESEIESELGAADFGLTDKGRMPLWNMGSIFFKDSAGDIFRMIKDLSRKYEASEEPSLMVMTTNNLLWATMSQADIGDRFVPANIIGAENINERVKKINISYNLRMWNIDSTVKIAKKPIRAIHFSPSLKNELDFFMYGKNKINTVLISERLIKIFHKYGIK